MNRLKEALLVGLTAGAIVVVACAYIIFWGKILALLAPLIGAFVMLVGAFLIVFHVMFLVTFMNND